jgi:hypothetical protein
MKYVDVSPIENVVDDSPVGVVDDRAVRLLLSIGLFIYSAKMCLRGKPPPRLGYLAPALEVAGGLF